MELRLEYEQNNEVVKQRGLYWVQCESAVYCKSSPLHLHEFSLLEGQRFN